MERKNQGITLIALIITIIIMLILAGIVLNLTIGEHGIVKRAKQGGEEYKIAQIKEQVEEEILALDMDKVVKGETLTVEQALRGIEENGTFEEIDLDENIGIVDGYIIQLGYNEIGKVVILGMQKDSEIGLRVKRSTKEYTNQNVEVSITVKGMQGNIASIEVPTEFTKKADNVYEIGKNGTYKIKATLEDGQQIEKEIIIENIDKLAPKEFSINIEEKTEEGFTIAAQAQDQEANESNASSGIEKYEYYLTNSKNETIKSETNIIRGITPDVYSIKVIAYDKANNSKEVTKQSVAYAGNGYLWSVWDCNVKQTYSRVFVRQTNSSGGGYTSYSLDKNTGIFTTSRHIFCLYRMEGIWKETLLL